jgi:hypothetical protein
MLLLGLQADSPTQLVLSNLTTLVGVLYYCVLTFRGYAILPFIRKPEYFIMPVPFLILVAVTCTICGQSISFFGASEYVLNKALPLPV